MLFVIVLLRVVVVFLRFIKFCLLCSLVVLFCLCCCLVILFCFVYSLFVLLLFLFSVVF